MITESKSGSPEEILKHFGRKGMKWGVRNRSENVGSSRSQRRSQKKAQKREKFLAEQDAKRRKGEIYVSHLTNDQWDLKIKDAQRSYEQQSEVYKSIAERRRRTGRDF